MRVLITGGFGYVGGRIAKHLHEAGYDVNLGSSQPRSAPDWLRDTEVVELAWQTDKALERACHGIDAIVHAAGMNAQACANDPVAALEFNGVATGRLATAAARSGVLRFIYLSTAHVYGSPLEGSFTEGSCPRNLHPYATSHLAGEQVVQQAAQGSHLASIRLRLSNAFGAPMHKDSNCWMLLVNDLCRQAASNEELRLMSAGSQLRDFITLTDVSCAVEHLLRLHASRLADGLFNLGSGDTISILDMAERIAARWRILTGRDIAVVRPEIVGAPPGPLNYVCDKLKASGFRLSEPFDDEIDATLRLCLLAFGK